MLRLTDIVGNASDPDIADRLHHIEHDGGIERVRLSRNDLARRRQRLVTDRGTELALLLDRGAQLENGSVLLLEPGRAVLVMLDEPQWLVLRAAHAAGALEIGYFAGNMHWKVRFEADCLWIALEGPREGYLKRMTHLLARGDATVLDAPAQGGTRYLTVPHAH
jgi:urease accessory protein